MSHPLSTMVDGTTVQVDDATKKLKSPMAAQGVDDAATAQAAIDDHAADTDNPHEVTAAQVGAPPTSRAISAGTGLTGGGDLSTDRSLAVSFGTSGSTACVGNDSRLSDSRTPTTHASSHLPGGGDALTTAAAGTLTPGSSAGVGSAASFARSDHVHAVPAFGTGSGTFCEGDDDRVVGALQKDGGTMSGNIAMGGHKVTGLGTAIDDGDATSKAYVDALGTILSLLSEAVVLKAGSTMTGALRGTPGTTTYASTRTLDIATNNDFVFTDVWTGDIEITLSNGGDGSQGMIFAQQDGDGDHAVTIVDSGRTVLMDAGLDALNSDEMLAPNAVFAIGYYRVTIGGTAYTILSLLVLKAVA